MTTIEQTDLEVAIYISGSGFLIGEISAFETSSGCCIVHRLHVDSDHREKGIGKRLIGEVEKWAHKKGASSVFLSFAGSMSRKERKVAENFLNKLGYEVSGDDAEKRLTF